MMSLADKSYSEGNFTKAKFFYQKALEQGGNKAIIYFNMGNIYYRENAIGEAIDSYKKVTEIAPMFRDAHLNLGKIYYLYEEYISSVNVFLNYLTIGTNDYEVHLLLGDIYRELRSYEKSLYYYEEAIKIKPETEDGYLATSSFYLSLGDSDKALSELIRGTYKCDNNSRLQQESAALLSESGNHIEAAAILKILLVTTVVTDNNDGAETRYRLYNELATSFLNAGYTNSALETLQNCIIEFPSKPDSARRAGDIYISSKRYDDAITFYSKLFAINKVEGYTGLRKLFTFAYNNDNQKMIETIVEFFKKNNINFQQLTKQ